MATAVARKKVTPRERMDIPEGNILNLQGLDRIQGFGDSMQISKMRGEIKIDEHRASEVRATTDEPSGGKIEHVGGGELITDVRTGQSQVYIQPLHQTGVLLNGIPSVSEEMGVVLGQRRYFFNAAMGRGEGGQWSPLVGAPAKHQWHVVDEQGRPQHPDIVKKVFDLLMRAAELYYRANYRDFVLAELAWFNNGILEFEEGAALVQQLKQSGKKPTKAQEQTIATFYKARFSGHIKSFREGEERIRDWLETNPGR